MARRARRGRGGAPSRSCARGQLPPRGPWQRPWIRRWPAGSSSETRSSRTPFALAICHSPRPNTTNLSRFPALSGAGGRRLAELAVVEVGVEAARRQQRGVGAALGDAAGFYDQDHIRIADRTEAVRDDHARPAIQQGSESFLDEAFGTGVHVA